MPCSSVQELSWHCHDCCRLKLDFWRGKRIALLSLVCSLYVCLAGVALASAAMPCMCGQSIDVADRTVQACNEGLHCKRNPQAVSCTQDYPLAGMFVSISNSAVADAA